MIRLTLSSPARDEALKADDPSRGGRLVLVRLPTSRGYIQGRWMLPATIAERSALWPRGVGAAPRLRVVSFIGHSTYAEGLANDLGDNQHAQAAVDRIKASLAEGYQRGGEPVRYPGGYIKLRDRGSAARVLVLKVAGDYHVLGKWVAHQHGDRRDAAIVQNLIAAYESLSDEDKREHIEKSGGR